MDTESFLQKILPSEGIYVVAVVKPDGLHQYFVDSIHAAAEVAQWWDNNGNTVYYATASYKSRGSRKAANVQALKSLRLDIDCGPDKPYATKRDAVIALLQFCREVAIPAPMLVDSGGGIHAYWPLRVALPPELWLAPATLLKQACVLYGLHADAAVTSDVARILRPVGVYHRKGEPRMVKLLQDASESDVDLVQGRLEDAIAERGALPLRILPEPQRNLNSDLSGGVEYPPVDALRVADRCAQVAQMRDTQGDVHYEQWRGVIGILKHCENGEKLAYDWSAQREDTGHSQLDVKTRWDSWSAGPTTCEFFRKQNPEPCSKCKHSKLVSPIVLGRPDPVETTNPEVPEAPVAASTTKKDLMPRGYRRGEDGKLYVKVDDGWQEFSKYDVLPVCMERDEAGDVVVRLHVLYPQEGRRELLMPMTKMAEPREFKKLLYSKGICLRSEEDVKTMSGYLIRYIDELQNSHAPTQLYPQMGWTKDNGFVWGDNLYTAAGAQKASLSTSIPESIREGFTPSGTLDEWKQAINAYALPGMEGYAFGFLSAPGAVLLRFTPYKGMILSLVSPTPGEGKSTVQNAINSFFGDPAKTALQAKDTVLAQYNRLSIYQNIAATVDEVTVMQPEQLSEFAYQIPQGRQRLRLTRDASERTNALEWSTIVVTSSNQSLVAKLATLKHAADAETVRIFEYYIRHPRTMKKNEADKLFGKLRDNYGLAGPIFAEYVAKNLGAIQQLIDQLQQKIDHDADIQSRERFWSALMAVNLAGGFICNQLGLTNFDMKALYKWSINQLEIMRGTVTATEFDYRALLGAYLNELQGSILVVDRAADARRGSPSIVKVAPHGSLFCRVEQETGKAWIARDHIRRWLIGRMADYNEVVRVLTDEKVLLQSSIKKSLGHGTYYTTTPTVCWEVDVSSTAALKLVADTDVEGALEATA